MKVENIESEWEKRNITDAHKVEEISDTYKSLGFEVLVKTYNSERDCKGDCDVCLKIKGEECKVIFTRANESNSDEDLIL